MSSTDRRNQILTLENSQLNNNQNMNPTMAQSDIQASQLMAQHKPGSDAGHKHRYKNVGLDSQEMRRRREEEGIQLRKQKREQQLFKRRNVTTDDTLQVTIV